jgi:hypothetical protein
MDPVGVKAHLELETELVAAGHAVAYRVVNDGSRSVGYGPGSVVQQRDVDGWTTVSPGGWYAPMRREVASGQKVRAQRYGFL